MKYFTEEHEEFRRSLAQFVATEINPYVDKWEEDKIFPAHELFAKMGKLGFLGVSYDEKYGGAGGDDWFSVVLAEELGKIDCAAIPMAISVHTDMCTPALAKYGSEELKEKFLIPSIRGEIVGAIAVSEPNAGSDVAAITTNAHQDGDHYVINGSKMYITNGTQADWLCLLARTSPGEGYKGMSLFCVPTNTPGYVVSKKLEKMGNHASDTAIINFDDMRVPSSHIIGEEGKGFYLQMEQFQRERLIGSIWATTQMEKAVRETIHYCRERKAFGKKLLDNQWIQFKIGELLTEIECLRHLNYHCAELMASKAPAKATSRIASMCKLKAGRLARQVADTCVQFHGGMGYMSETKISRYFRDARLLSIGGGADEVMLDVIAKLEGLQ